MDETKDKVTTGELRLLYADILRRHSKDNIENYGDIFIKHMVLFCAYLLNSEPIWRVESRFGEMLMQLRRVA